MPKREQLFKDMQGENAQAALLIAQVGAAPTELQLVVETAEYEESKGGLRPLNSYIIRVLGVVEHRVVNLGTTVGHVELVTEHPLLHVYNSRPAAVFFRGEVSNPNELVLDIAQAHATTFGSWRHFPEYLNMEQPLFSLLESGGGMIGQMPQPLADAIVSVLEKHKVEHKMVQGDMPSEKHSNPMLQQQQAQALLIGGSYFISYAFAVDEMGKA